MTYLVNKDTGEAWDLDSADFAIVDTGDLSLNLDVIRENGDSIESFGDSTPLADLLAPDNTAAIAAAFDSGALAEREATRAWLRAFMDPMAALPREVRQAGPFIADMLSGRPMPLDATPEVPERWAVWDDGTAITWAHRLTPEGALACGIPSGPSMLLTGGPELAHIHGRCAACAAGVKWTSPEGAALQRRLQK